MTLRCHTAVMVAEEPTHQSSISNQDYTSSSDTDDADDDGSFVTRLSCCIDIRVILYVNSEIQG
jgi:hypothetical protein